MKELDPYAPLNAPNYFFANYKKHEIVDTAEELVEFERHQDVKFFEVTKQVFPKFTTVVKVEF